MIENAKKIKMAKLLFILLLLFGCSPTEQLYGVPMLMHVILMQMQIYLIIVVSMQKIGKMNVEYVI